MKNNQPVSGSHIISLEEATEMNKRYRKEKAKVLEPSVDPDILPICETFSRGDFDSLLAQEGCEGIRIYYGMKEDQKICAVIVGVNGDNEDMVEDRSAEKSGASVSESGGIIIDNGVRCPTDCPPPSPLN